MVASQYNGEATIFNSIPHVPAYKLMILSFGYFTL